MSERPSNGSKYCGFFKFPVDEFDHQHPLDTALALDGVMNNLEALYNGHFQVRINDIVSGSKAHLRGTQATPLPSNERSFLETYGPFPITKQKNGEYAPLHIEVACATNFGSAANSRLYVRLRPARQREIRTSTLGIFTWEGYVNLSGTTVQYHRLTTPTNSQISMDPFFVFDQQEVYTKISASSTSTERSQADVSLFYLDLHAFVPAGSSAYGVKYGGIYARECAFLSGAT